MGLILLGSGTGVPLRGRGSPALMLQIGPERMIFDIGPGTMGRLMKAGVDFLSIGHIFISHFHPDHTADLIHLLFATKNPNLLYKKRPFTLTGPEGLKDFIGRLRLAYEPWLDLPAEIMQIDELAIQRPDERTHGHFNIKSIPIKHTRQSLAYRAETHTGRSFVYSGDTGFCDEIIEIADGCDLLALECSMPDNQGINGHLTPSLAGRIAMEAAAKKLLLIHFYPETLSTDIARGCRQTYSGELILGRDNLHIFI